MSSIRKSSRQCTPSLLPVQAVRLGPHRPADTCRLPSGQQTQAAAADRVPRGRDEERPKGLAANCTKASHCIVSRLASSHRSSSGWRRDGNAVRQADRRLVSFEGSRRRGSPEDDPGPVCDRSDRLPRSTRFPECRRTGCVFFASSSNYSIGRAESLPPLHIEIPTVRRETL